MSSELTKRILSSIVLIAIVLNCLFISNYAWLVLLIIVALLSWFEFLNLTIKIYKNVYPKIFLSLLSFSLYFFLHILLMKLEKKLEKLQYFLFY